MYKIMLADDEGIVIDSLRFIIQKNFSKECEIESAKTGRSVIELAESFRPDIAFMDIQMPGINGIEAMKEIRKNSPSTIFIVMSAYDKFDYAREAINLGVLEYLHKPVNQKKIVAVIERAMRQIDDKRTKRSDDLRIKEKLEIVVPMIESGLVSAVLLQGAFSDDAFRYKELLGVKEEYGEMIILEYGDNIERGALTNPVGTSIQVQSSYGDIREVLKEYFSCIVGPMMTNKIPCFIPKLKMEEEYENRSETIECAREMVHKLNHRFELKFRVGIGSIQQLDELYKSYQDAANALHNSDRAVAHCRDLSLFCAYADDYPSDIEKELFENVKLGKEEQAKDMAMQFFDWMERNYASHEMDIKLKALEFVLLAEHIAYESGGMTYHFLDRKDYLPELLQMKEVHVVRNWFLKKIAMAARNVKSKKNEYANSAVEKAKEYIQANYRKDLSLESVSRKVDMSSYYFSKLFKDVAGENFIEYVTEVRIEAAKPLLEEKKMSIKEVCAKIGYSDPNYFSRIFKKCVGITPSEYREGNR